MNGYEIPLIAQPQTLTITLAGVVYQLYVYWCEPAQAWGMDISDNSGNPLITGIALVTGTDLLGQYAFLELGGLLVVFSDGADPLASPTFTNLGSGSHLYWISDTQ